MRAPIRGRRFRQRARFIGGVVGFIVSEQAPTVGTSAGVPSGTGAPARPTPEGGQPQPRHVQPKTTGKQATNNPKTSQKQPTDTANA